MFATLLAHPKHTTIVHPTCRRSRPLRVSVGELNVFLYGPWPVVTDMYCMKPSAQSCGTWRCGCDIVDLDTYCTLHGGVNCGGVEAGTRHGGYRHAPHGAPGTPPISSAANPRHHTSLFFLPAPCSGCPHASVSFFRRCKVSRAGEQMSKACMHTQANTQT